MTSSRDLNRQLKLACERQFRGERAERNEDEPRDAAYGGDFDQLDSAAQLEIARKRLAELLQCAPHKRAKLKILEAGQKITDALRAQDDLAGAVEAQKELLAEMNMRRNDEHRLDGQLKLGMMLGELGKHREALEELWDNVDVYKKAEDAIPVNLISALTWNMIEEGHRHNLSQAEIILRDVLENNAKLEKGDLHNLRVLLANALHKMGKVKDEVELRKKVLECAQAEHGQDSIVVKENEKQLAEAEALNHERRNCLTLLKIMAATLVVAFAVCMVPYG